MFGDLFNGLFGSSKASKSSDIQTQLEQQQYLHGAEQQLSEMSVEAYYQKMLAQRQAMMNQGMGSGGLSQVVREFITIGKSEYDELTSLSNWCQSVHPEVYEEWRAMQDLKKASEDEST